MARTCPTCHGAQEVQSPSSANAQDPDGWIECPTCDGTGVLLDDADHDSAEELRNERILQEQDREELRRHE